MWISNELLFNECTVLTVAIIAAPLRELMNLVWMGNPSILELAMSLSLCDYPLKVLFLFISLI